MTSRLAGSGVATANLALSGTTAAGASAAAAVASASTTSTMSEPNPPSLAGPPAQSSGPSAAAAAAASVSVAMDRIATADPASYPPGTVGLLKMDPPSLGFVPLMLTELEQELFSKLQRVVAEKKLDTTLRVAGGWVRDKLIGGPMPEVDIDIAVDTMLGASFAELFTEWLEAETGERQHSVGVIQRNPEQSKHLETARMKVMGLWVDLVNLRTETYTHDSRIPNIELGSPQEDAMRRDLTINALFYNINTGVVEDWTGHGVNDIQRRIVRTPLPPRTTLLDDPLRALRAVRFAARLRFSMDEELITACQDADVHTAFSSKISRERVFSEVDAIIRAPSAVRGVGLLSELGLFPLVFRTDNVGGKVNDSAPGSPTKRPVDDVLSSSSSPAEFSAASLGALASLDALLSRDFQSWKTGPAALSPEEVRLARYAALTLPLVGRKASPNGATGDGERVTKKRVREMSATEFVLHEELRMATRDVSAVVSVHKAIDAFQELAKSVSSSGALSMGAKMACSIDTTVPSSSSLPDLEEERLTLGMVIRNAGCHWRVALLTALIADLPLGVAAANFFDGDDIPAVSLAAGTEAVVASYERVAQRVAYHDLGEAWSVRPLVDGRAVAKVLPKLPRGPIVGEIMKQQVRWQLSHPGLTVGSCSEWILKKYGDQYA